VESSVFFICYNSRFQPKRTEGSLMGMNKIICFTIISVFAFSCENKDIDSPCYQYHGKIIMTSCCTGSTFITITSPQQIGKNTNLNGQDYLNVIQVPDYLTGTDIYLNLRTYDPDKDGSLFPFHCMCFIAVGMDVPVFVATGISSTTCSGQESVH